MTYSQEQLADILNEYQRRFIDEPEAFAQQWADIRRTLEEEAAGEPVSYGTDVVAYMYVIGQELFG
jgi:hypothetical protein